MAQPGTQPKKPRRNRDQVIATAIRILDAEGPDALTYRRLAAELDTGIGSLYWHVENKNALMTLALDVALAEIDDSFDQTPGKSWEPQLRAGIIALWTTLRRRPWAAEIAVTSAERSPHMLRFWDRAATLLFAAGLDTEDVAYAIATLRTYVIGNSMQHAVWHTYGSDPGQAHATAVANADALYRDLSPELYPHFSRLVPVYASHSEHAQFLHGLNLILAGLLAESA